VSSNPPPDSLDELPAYLEAHHRELNRVTDRWAAAVTRVFDPLTHNTAVERVLQVSPRSAPCRCQQGCVRSVCAPLQLPLAHAGPAEATQSC
jgi:hypothetical protein